MADNITDIENLKNYFTVKAEKGKKFPNVKSVNDGTIFFKLESDGIYVEHIMLDGRWHKKIVDSNSQVTLEQV